MWPRRLCASGTLSTVALLLGVGGCGSRPPTPPVPNSDLRMTLQIAPRQVRQMDPATLTVHLRDRRGRPVEGARVSADLAMPAMDMGRNAFPAKPLGGGDYAGTGRFTMGGDWIVTIRAAKGSSHAVQTFPMHVR